MTDAKHVPLWLRPANQQQFANETPAQRYCVSKDVEQLADEAAYCEYPGRMEQSIEAWLAWRERIAKALGLVDPDRMTLADWRDRMGFTGADERARNAAIAAELRRLADDLRVEESPDAEASEYYEGRESGFVDGQQDAADRLRARADELDKQSEST